MEALNLEKALAYQEKENASQKEQISHLKKENKQLDDRLKDESDHFKRVFWNIYIYKK